jgi:hypothetical protein
MAESMRLAEIGACMSALDTPPGKSVCPPTSCSRWNICHGDLAHACAATRDTDLERRRAASDRSSLAHRLEPFWKMDTIFLDQSNVDGLSGYDFHPSALRSLFRAGAEAARVRCLDIAALIGVLKSDPPPTAADIKNVNQWCSAKMADVPTTCPKHLPSYAPFTVRACGTPIDLSKLPSYLDACPNEVPQ